MTTQIPDLVAFQVLFANMPSIHSLAYEMITSP